MNLLNNFLRSNNLPRANHLPANSLQVNNLQLRAPQTKQMLFPWINQRLHLLNVQLPSYFFSAGISIVFVLLFNKSFFFAAWNTQQLDSLSALAFLFSLAPLLWLLTFLLINLFCIPYVAKPMAIFLLIAGAFAAYFMDAYGLTIDKEMLRNAWETDTDEVEGLVNIHLIGYVTFLGVLPAVLVAKTQIRWGRFWLELRWRLIPAVVSLVISVIIILSLSDYYSSFFRNHKDVRFLANPLGFINAAIGLTNESIQRPLAMEAISSDAQLGAGTTRQTKPVLVVFVVGDGY